jgi:hypothetical protein
MAYTDHAGVAKSADASDLKTAQSLPKTTLVEQLPSGACSDG